MKRFLILSVAMSRRRLIVLLSCFKTRQTNGGGAHKELCKVLWVKLPQILIELNLKNSSMPNIFPCVRK